MAMVASTKNLNFSMSAKKPYQLVKPSLTRLRVGNVDFPAISSCGTKRKAEDSERKEVKRNREDTHSESNQIRVLPAKSVLPVMEVKTNKEEDWKREQKTLRVEMLKSRFAHIISKAQTQIVGSCGTGNDKFDQVKVNTEDLKLQQRQREREAARKALEKMEGSEAFEDNIKTLKEFAFMIGDYSFKSVRI